MVTDATKRYREVLAYALLAVAALYFLGSISLLFKSLNGAGFAVKSAFVGSYFQAPIPVLSLVLAVLLVTRLGELSPNARVVVLTALGIAALDLLFAVITFFAQFGASVDLGYAGIGTAGKLVGAIFGLAQLIWLAAACGYLYTAFLSLPAPAAAPQPWAAQGYQPYGGSAPQAWGQQPPRQPPAQPPYPGSGYPAPGWSQQGWAAGPPPPRPPEDTGYRWAAPGAPEPGRGAPVQPGGWPPPPPDSRVEPTGSSVFHPEDAAAPDLPMQPEEPVEPVAPVQPEQPEPPSEDGDGQPRSGDGWWQHPGS